MTKYKKKRIKDLTNEYNKYVTLINKEDFNVLPCNQRLTITRMALNKADKLIAFINRNGTF